MGVLITHQIDEAMLMADWMVVFGARPSPARALAAASLAEVKASA